MFAQLAFALVSAFNFETATPPDMQAFELLEEPQDKVRYLERRNHFFESVEVDDFFGKDSAEALAAKTQQAKWEHDISIVWGDTILEGPYRTFGETRSNVEILTYNGQAFAYEISVKQNAVMEPEGDCRFDDAQGRYVGEDCYFGTISETMYFSMKFEELGNPSWGYASFED